jgi:hypothetical protein
MKFQRGVALAALCVLLSACTHTAVSLATQTSVNWTAEKTKRVVVIDPDVVLSELTTGGISEARADWTAAGKDFIKSDIGTFMASKNIDAVPSGDITDPRELQLIKLHGAVGVAILENGILNLPTKGKNFDWTLGPGAAALRDHYGCDYALFVFMRDSYSSAGRTAMIIGAAILGIGIQGGQQIGFASLVDLRSGRIVWFNRLASSNGSLKDAKGANDTVANLLSGMPL